MTYSEKVRQLLLDHPELRDSDRKLIGKFWEVYDNFELTSEQKRQFMSATDPETIRRARQKLQEDERNTDIHASPKVQERRARKGAAVAHGHAEVEEVLEAEYQRAFDSMGRPVMRVARVINRKE